MAQDTHAYAGKRNIFLTPERRGQLRTYLSSTRLDAHDDEETEAVSKPREFLNQQINDLLGVIANLPADKRLKVLSELPALISHMLDSGNTELATQLDQGLRGGTYLNEKSQQVSLLTPEIERVIKGRISL